VTTAAAEAQALANGLAQSSKSIADSSKATSQYFDSFVKRLKEVDNTFNRGAFSQTLKAITGNSRSAEDSSRSISRLANDYRQLQASVTGLLPSAITVIKDALNSSKFVGTPQAIKQITDELTKLNAVAGQSDLSASVSQSLKLKNQITATLADTKQDGGDTAGQKIKNISSGVLRNFEGYQAGLKGLGVTISSEATAIAANIRTVADAIKTTQSGDVENLRQMVLNLSALQESFQAEMDKSKTVVTQFTSQADLVAASLQNIRDADPSGVLASTVSSYEDLVNLARDKSKQLLASVAEDRFKQLRDVSFKIVDELKDSLFGEIYKLTTAQLDAMQKGLETFASNVGTRSMLLAQGLKASFQGGGTVATTVEAMSALGRLNFKAGTDELTQSAAMAVKMAEALGVSGSNAAHLVFYSRQAGVNLVAMGDTLATIRENTRLTADEFGRFTKELGDALMIMGNISNYAEVIKSTLKIDDALRQFTGQSGDYVNFFKQISTTSGGMQTAMALGMNPENLGNQAEQQRFISSLGEYVDRLTKNQPLLQQIAVLEDLSQQTGLSVVALRNLSKASAELTSRTEDNLTLDQRYANEVANLGKSVSSISESLQKLLAAGMWPFVTALSYAAQGLALLLEKLRAIPGVFETLAFMGGVVVVGAFGLLISSLRQLAVWAPIATAGLRALMATTVGSSVSGVVSTAAGGAGAGAATGMGATLMTFLVKPLIAIFTPIAKALALLLTPLGILGVVLTGLAAYFIKKDVELIRDINKLNDDNSGARARNAEQIRSDVVRRSREAQGATISTAGGLSDSDRLATLSIQGAGGRETNFGDLMTNRQKMISGMMRGEGGTEAISSAQAAEFKSELAQRDVVYLRNAIAAKQSDLVTESRPPTKEETDQLRLLTDMVKYLEKQVGITQGQADDLRKKQDEREQFEQIQRVQKFGDYSTQSAF
tara:strand:- start:32752 stop:35589 length:2838 start_codon:yes stop_codon:yes gene_type:complete